MARHSRVIALASAVLVTASLAGPALADTAPAPDPTATAPATPDPTATPAPASEPTAEPTSAATPDTATWVECTDTSTECPVAPVGVSATATVDSVQVAWEWPEGPTAPDEVTSVLVRVSPGDHEVVVAAAETTALVEGLDADTEYSVTVLSAAVDQLSVASEPTLVTTLTDIDTGSDVVDAAMMKPMATPGDVESLIVTLVSDQATEVQAQQASDSLPVAGVAVASTQDLGGDSAVVDLTEGVSDADAALIIQDLEADPNVESVSVNRRVQRATYPATSPDDPYWTGGSLWGLYGTNGIGIASSTTTMNNVWTSGQGSGAVVAVLDTGSTVHPDLNANYVAGYDFVRSSAPDTSGARGRSGATNGDGDYVDTATYGALGWDGNPLDPGDWDNTYDSSWHGTHVAGTIAAVGNNAEGVIGVAPQAQIQPVRVLSFGGGWSSDIQAAIRWASGASVTDVPANSNPADVINLSLGGSGDCTSDWQSAIDTAVANGSVVVVSAGNSNLDASSFVPANCNNVITVAASTTAGVRASYSNYGATVEITAPGSGIWSTMNSGTTTVGSPTYVSYSGTSMAAPHVSGVAALLRSLDASLTPSQVLTRLQGSVKAFPVTGSPYDCTTSICGAGLLTAASAVVLSPSIADVSPAGGPSTGGTTVTVTGANLDTVTAVTFGGAAATSFTLGSATSLTAVAPAGTAGAATLEVTNPSGSATATYTYYDAPTISSVSPISGTTAGGDSVTITGTNLGGTTGVTFGGTAGTLTAISATSVTVTNPSKAAGAVDVVVTTLGGTVTSSGGFTYLPMPVITGVSPDIGTAAGGDTVTITGSNMATVTDVTFGGTVADITATTSTSVTVTTRSHAAGVVDVVVTNPDGSDTEASAYRYFPIPTASTIDVASGSTAGGTRVVVSGTDFMPASVWDTSWIDVTFGGAAATVWLVDDTSVWVDTPAHSAGVVDVVVTTPGGSSTLTDAFEFIAPVTSTPPPASAPSATASDSGSSSGGGGGGGDGLHVIQVIVPQPSGAPGSTIALAGWGLGGTEVVYFNDYTASFRVVSDAEVVVTVPDIPPGVYVIHAQFDPSVGRASYWPGFHVLPKGTVVTPAPGTGTTPGTPGTSPGTASSAADLVGFKANSATLSGSTKAKLRRMAAKVDDSTATGTVLVFSDKRGTAKSTKVAQSRARNIVSYLRSQGIEGEIRTMIEKGSTSTLRKSALVRLTSSPGTSVMSSDERILSLIVRYAKGVSPTADGKVRGSSYVTGGLGSGMTLGPNLGLRTYRVDFASPVTLAQAQKAADQMLKDKGVQVAEPDRIVRATITAN